MKVEEVYLDESVCYKVCIHECLCKMDLQFLTFLNSILNTIEPSFTLFYFCFVLSHKTMSYPTETEKSYIIILIFLVPMSSCSFPVLVTPTFIMEANW